MLVKFGKFVLAVFFLWSGATLLLFLMTGLLGPRSQPPPLTPIDRETLVLGSRIRYRVHGSGSPVFIFLHGFGGSLQSWEEVMPLISHGQGIALDLVGFGGSDRPPLTYDLETQRQYLLAFMDELHIQQAVLVGFSMGASVAAWTAAQTEERVAGLILIAPSAYPGSLTYPWPRGWLYRPGPANRLASAIVNNKVFRWLFPSSLLPQALGVTNSYDSQFAEALKDIHQPTLLVWSRGDKKVPFKYHRIYKEHIQNLKFLEMPAPVSHGFRAKEAGSFINSFASEFFSAG